MANRERGQITVEVEGQAYALALTTNAMCEIEELLSTPEKDVTFLQAIRKVKDGNIRVIRAIVCAAMRAHRPTFSVADAGVVIQQNGGVIKFMPIVNRLIDASRADPEDEGRPRKAQDVTTGGTGGRSTSRPGAAD